MGRKLVTRILESSNELEGRRRMWDPVVEAGYTHEEVQRAIKFCEDNELIRTETKQSEFATRKNWWEDGLSIKGRQLLKDLDSIHGGEAWDKINS